MAKAFRRGGVGRFGLPFLAVLGLFASSAAVAQVAPASTHAGFAAAWQQGRPVDVTGPVTVIYSDDFVNRRSERLYWVKDRQTRQSYQIRFEKDPTTNLRTGSIIRISGRAVGSDLYVLADQTESSGTGTFNTQTVVPAATSTSGDQRTLVIVANFGDTSVSCSNDFINDAMFADPTGLSVNSLYSVNSLGQVSLSGSVVGPYILNANSTDSCNLTGWADAADAAATAGGENLAAYTRKLYVMPLNTCPGAGFGTVGGSPSAAWVFTCDLKGVYAHEIGHNLGMDHAATPTSEYGDTTDPMSFGSDPLRGVNAPHRQELGWLGANSTQGVNSDAVYDVAPLALDPLTVTAPQTILIAKPDTQEKYYLSYRTSEGFDNFIDSSYYARLSIHRYKGDGSSSKTFLLAGLADGQSFVDQVNGISVTQVSHDSTHATVRVHIETACLPGAPSASLSPQSQSGIAGNSLTYMLSLTNNDSAACGPSTFTLSGAYPAGWTGSLSPASLSVGPGMTAQATFTVASSSGAAVGGYQVIVNAIDNTASVHATSVPGEFSVTAPCVPSAPSVVPSPSSQVGAPGATVTYDVAVTNRDSGGCSASTLSVQTLAPAGWSGAPSPSAVRLGPGQTTNVIVSVTSASAAAPASYAISTATFDGSQVMHAASADMTYTVQTPTDSVPPTAPASLSASLNQKLKRIQLSWNAATDNVGVVGYVVSRNSAAVATVTSTTSWSDASYVAGATYTYSVSAFDAAGNVSSASNTVSLTVAGGSGGKKR
jgi:hypothetical protein